MEILKIGSDSLKISLCTKETFEYNLNELDNETVKNSFIKLLIKIRESISFNVTGEKVVAEIFTGKDGGCEIFISRVEVREEMYKERVLDEAVKKPRHITAIYSFEELERVLMVAKRLKDINFNGESSLYYDEKREKYYILLEDVSSKDLKYAFLNEYAKNIKSSLCPIIKEHFKCVCKKDLIKKLSSLY